MLLDRCSSKIRKTRTQETRQTPSWPFYKLHSDQLGDAARSISYILINSVMLLNVVVAVLLVGLQRVRYSKASMRAHESESLARCRTSSFLP